MSFIVFLVLFVVLCGWLDARVARPRGAKKEK